MIPETTIQAAVRPDAGPHVAGSGGEVAARRAGRHRDDRVLVPLQHKLRRARPGVPELDAPVLGARHDPLGIRRQGNTEHEVLLQVRGSVISFEYD